MRAAYIEQFGPPENIRYGQLPSPDRGATDVLVDVICTTVSSVDTLIRAGIYRVPVAFPFVTGRDLVGRVAEVGWGTSEFRVGDLVWCNSLGHGGRQGAAAKQVAVPADRLYHLPEGVSPADAVAVLHPAATAYLALFTHGHLSPGDTVLVAGAAGNVGSAAVTMAVAAALGSSPLPRQTRSNTVVRSAPPRCSTTRTRTYRRAALTSIWTPRATTT